MATSLKIKEKLHLNALKKKSFKFLLQLMLHLVVWIFHQLIWLFKLSHQKTPKLTFIDRDVLLVQVGLELA